MTGLRLELYQVNANRNSQGASRDPLLDSSMLSVVAESSMQSMRGPGDSDLHLV